MQTGNWLDKNMWYYFQIFMQDALKEFSRIIKDVTLNKTLDILSQLLVGFSSGLRDVCFLIVLRHMGRFYNNRGVSVNILTSQQ
jgi:2-succinyl-5-enolpyruvyl-6-hydroxy-3-cyclohexene-1-carboxylate synthase